MWPAPALNYCLLLVAALRAARLLLLHFGFGCIRILLLIVQLSFHVQIGLHLPIRIRVAARCRSSRDTILALVLGERLKTGIKLLAEVIVHFLQVINGHRELRAGMAIRLLAAAD